MEIHIKLNKTWFKKFKYETGFGMLTEVSIAGTITLDKDCSKRVNEYWWHSDSNDQGTMYRYANEKIYTDINHVLTINFQLSVENGEYRKINNQELYVQKCSQLDKE